MKSTKKSGAREPGAPDAGLSDRQAKQAAALKANLQRRKQQAKARAASAIDTGTTSSQSKDA